MKSNFIKIGIILVSVFTLAGCDIKLEPVKEEKEYITELKELGYTESEISLFEEKISQDDINTLTEYDFVKDISTLIESSDFQEEKWKDYLDSYDETKNIKYTLLLVNNDVSYPYDGKLSSILEQPYFLLKNLDRYMKYDSDDAKTIVANVNANLDYEFYTNVKDTDLSKDKLIITNKYYALASDYKDSDLVKMDSKYSYTSSSYLNKEAYEHFKEMADAGSEEGVNFTNKSAYRSYGTQKALYNRYFNEHGEEWANKWSAKPGHSEHQTGLALDVMKKGNTSFDKFETTDEYEWLKNNSYKYGFILRYPQGKEYITGYGFEAWHYRYVGVDAATYIYEHDITFEEYYAYFVEK